jgi:hypothetical protein
VNDDLVFYPSRRLGLALHAITMLGFSALGVYGLWRASQAQIGPSFLLSLLPAILMIATVPRLAYQFYALWTGSYIVRRDGIRLRWGLRIQQIPIDEVEWVHTWEDLIKPLPLPVLRLPGAVTGVRHIPAAQSAGEASEVEYLASRSRGMILIGTARRIYAISPAEPEEFLYAYQRQTELGSITPLPAQSSYPRFLVSDVWNSRPARYLILAGALMGLALLAWISLSIPTRSQTALGFRPDGSPGDLVSAVQLLLLPVLNGLIWVVDLVVGLFFFRRPATKALAYVLWGSSAVVSALFLLGAFFVLASG